MGQEWSQSWTGHSNAEVCQVLKPKLVQFQASLSMYENFLKSQMTNGLFE
jgi:hypothetical protein